MGAPNMDFVVREARHVVDGPMAFVRLGTCGSRGLEPGTVAIARSSVFVTTTSVSDAVMPDADLLAVLVDELETGVLTANASTDSFYSSQGRVDPNFTDPPCALPADVGSIEMESYQLLYLASIGRDVKAAACAIVCADRLSGAVIDTDRLHTTERAAGEAVLRALAKFPLT